MLSGRLASVQTFPHFRALHTILRIPMPTIGVYLGKGRKLGPDVEPEMEVLFERALERESVDLVIPDDANPAVVFWMVSHLATYSIPCLTTIPY